MNTLTQKVLLVAVFIGFALPTATHAWYGGLYGGGYPYSYPSYTSNVYSYYPYGYSTYVGLTAPSRTFYLYPPTQTNYLYPYSNSYGSYNGGYYNYPYWAGYSRQNAYYSYPYTFSSGYGYGGYGNGYGGYMSGWYY